MTESTASADLESALGIDRRDPRQALALRLVAEDWHLIEQLHAARDRAGLSVEDRPRVV